MSEIMSTLTRGMPLYLIMVGYGLYMALVFRPPLVGKREYVIKSMLLSSMGILMFTFGLGTIIDHIFKAFEVILVFVQ